MKSGSDLNKDSHNQLQHGYHPPLYSYPISGRCGNADHAIPDVTPEVLLPRKRFLWDKYWVQKTGEIVPNRSDCGVDSWRPANGWRDEARGARTMYRKQKRLAISLSVVLGFIAFLFIFV
jgi:hypothetical protein